MPKPSLRQRIARWLDPRRVRVGSRMYAGARMTNATLGFGSGGNTSADAELAISLQMLRNRSRQLVRDSAYAKRAKTVVVNNVIGSGVGMQAQVGTTRGQLNASLNDRIETAHAEWSAADQCHVGGKLHFHDIERLAMGEVFEAGEVLIRMHFSRFGSSRVPLSLEVIEAERLANELIDPGSLIGLDNDVRMGVEIDRYQRPLAYWIRRGHPGDIRSRTQDAERYERVPASDVFHMMVINRWPQSRGEPWMHATLRKLDDLSEYSQHEVTAARASAAYFGTISREDGGSPPVANPDIPDERPTMTIDPLTIQQLDPGETFSFHSPNRPNSALDGFMRAMLREIAAGTGVSYESLSRDYSQSNYSSSRLALLDDRDLWRVLQQWWLRSFRLPLYRMWLQQAVLGGAIEGLQASTYASDAARYQKVLFKPRGWSWVDPTKEVEAYKEAVRAGFITTTDVIAQTGGGMDIEDVINTRKRELEMFAEADIELDTTVQVVPPPVKSVEPAVEEDEEEDDAPERSARVLNLRNNA